VLRVAGATVVQLFLLTAILNAAVAAFIYLRVPEFLYRFLAWVLANLLYRLHTEGRDTLPVEGPALIVCNHVSFVDAILLSAVSPRPIRFVMHRDIFRIAGLAWLFRRVRAIPIASAREDAALMERAFAAVSEELRDGGLVCIFPEGGLTRDGQVGRFRPGLVRILERDPVPVVPVALQGLWGSMFSRHPGTLLRRRLARGVLSRIGIVVGTPVPAADATPEHLQQVVARLRGSRA